LRGRGRNAPREMAAQRGRFLPHRRGEPTGPRRASSGGAAKRCEEVAAPVRAWDLVVA